MGDVLEYSDVVQENLGVMNPGRLKLQTNNLIFKNMKSGIIDTFASSDIERTYWLQRARGHCLKIRLTNGNIHRFDGLRETEYDKLKEFLHTHFEQKLEKVDLSLKGWNWGQGKFKGNGLSFEIGSHPAFEIPLNQVSHSMTAKNEVTLEFHQNDDAPVSLMEIRFHIPQTAVEKDVEKKENDGEEGEEGEEGELEIKDAAQEFLGKVLEKADVIQATGDAIAVFSEIHCLTPRGRYDIKIYPTFLQLHGKTFDYKIPYTTILRLFLLPHRDGRQMFFVVSLDPPIKQGQTRYPFLILLFNKEVEITLEISLSEEDINEKYEGKLSKEMSGLEYEVVSRIFKTLVNRKITVPGTFMGNSGLHSIACSFKAATGFLYPLERGFVFIHKPPMHIRFDEVACVNFSRSSGNTRSFDFDIDTKTGTTYTFVSIEKDEYGKLYDFVTQKKLRIKNVGALGKKLWVGQSVYKEDMSDSDAEGTGHDAYLERMKREGLERDDEEYDSDEDDSDFAPVESASDVAEEYDSNPETTESSEDEDDSGESGEEKPKKKKEKKPKSAKTVREPGMGKPRKPRKPKKHKDPDMPKRAPTSYMIWLNEVREEIKEENPGIAITELTKLAGEKWRNLDDKSKWEEMAREAKEEHKKAMEVYNAKVAERGDESESGDDSKEVKKKKKATKTSPQKDSRAGSGAGYKSKEYISESSSEEDSDEKPLKRKKGKSSSSDEDKPLKKPKKEEADSEEDDKSFSGSGSEEEGDETPERRGPSKRQRKEEPDIKVEEDKDDNLPSEEEILEDKDASEGEESGKGSGSGSGSASEED